MIFDEKDRIAAAWADHCKEFFARYPDVELYDDICADLGYEGIEGDQQIILICTPSFGWSYREMA